VLLVSGSLFNVNARYPHAHPVKKLARRAKCGEKLAKKAQLFTLELFGFPPPAAVAAATSNQASRDDGSVRRLAALALQSSRCLPAFATQRLNARVNAQLSRFLLFVFVPHQRTKLHTHTYKHIIIIIDSTLTAR